MIMVRLCLYIAKVESLMAMAFDDCPPLGRDAVWFDIELLKFPETRWAPVRHDGDTYKYTRTLIFNL